MSGFAEEKAYVRRIERRFLAQRGSGFVLSPRDFGLLLDWFHRGVPAELVTGAIDEVLKKAEMRSRRPRVFSIAYCRHAIEDAWEERRRALVGGAEAGAGTKSGTFTVEEVAHHLALVAAAMQAAAQWARRNEAEGGPAAAHFATGGADRVSHPGDEESRLRAAEVIASIANRLAGLRQSLLAHPLESFAPLESQLVDLETEMKAAARGLLPTAEVAEIASKTEARLAPFADRMSGAARAATIARAVDAAILARLKLLRLSLFAMSR